MLNDVRSGVLLNRISPQLWTPKSISNISDYFAAWWSADDHGTANMTDDGSGLISNWVDRVGGVAVTAATTARPVWSPTVMNMNHPGLTFDGVANCLVTTSLGGIPSGANVGEIWSVGKQNGAPAASNPICFYGGVNGGTERGLGCNNLFQTHVTDVSIDLFDTNALTTAPFVGTGQWSGTTMDGWTNGAAFPGNPATISALNTGTTRLRIGANNLTLATRFFQGAISEILVPKVLTDSVTLSGRNTTLKQDIEGWATWHYGFPASLPASHPFRYRAPTL